MIALLFKSAAPKDATWDATDTEFDPEGVFDKTPGMGLRLEQHTIDVFRRSLSKFLPHFVDYDLEFPKELHYAFNFLWDRYTWNIDFTNMKFE